MKEKTYLKWYNKVGYGSGDIAGNVVYALLSAFVMIFLTDTVGMNAGIVGSLIALSKLFDGVSDIFFGSLIDKTHTKMGKARPWMLYGYFGCAICLVASFCIPADITPTAQYAWFFIAYTLLNAGFYTANNIAYSALAGWLLAFSGYVGKAAEQSASTINMLHIMYLWMPMIFNLLITLILTRLNVEKANEELRAAASN